VTQTPLTPHRAIAERVKELRKSRGWSAQRLAEEVTAAGIQWDRSIVANLENGRRAALSVEEWLTLAYVLDVAPVNLLVPTSDDGPDFAVVPDQVIPPMDVREWIRGRQPIGNQDVDHYFSKIAANDFGFIYSALKRAQEKRMEEQGGER
jgi:transcriptional regulator with XRE-family HTH domain